MELFEREAPRALMNAAFRRVCDHEGAVVLVSGEAGIGKTAFVTEFTQTQRNAARVLWGACDPLFTPRPLGPLFDIAMRDLPHLLDLLNSSADWLTVAAALQKSLMTGPHPTIIVFEDIHWADEATLDLIRHLCRRVQQARALLILTYREDEVGGRHPLRSVLGDLPAQHTTRLRLEPLSRQAVETLARDLHRPASGVYEATRGNPFFVTEVLRGDGSGHSSSGGIPATVRDAVLTRAHSLDTPARDLLELASIVPGQAELWLLETVLHPEPAVIDRCIEGGFLLPLGDAPSPDGLGFRHELARLAIEASLSPARSKNLHQNVLDALEKAHEHAAVEVPLARLVHHAARAANAQKVLAYGPRAAARASLHGAHREAARYYQAVLRYRARIPTEEQARLLDALSFEYYLTGQIDGAIQVRQEAVELWRKAGQMLHVGDGLRWLSRLYWFQGNKAMADRLADEAIAVLEPLPPGKELAMSYSNRSQLYMLAHEQAGIAWGKKALHLAEALNETEITIHALTNIGTAELHKGDEAGWAKLGQALRLAQEHEMHDHVARCYANLTSQMIENRNYPLGEQYMAEGLAYTTDRDMDSYSVYLLGWRARCSFEQGRWAEAAADAEEVLRLHPGSVVIALPGITTLGHLQVRQGHPDAMRWLDQARDLALPTGELQRIGPVAVARAEAAWWGGRPEQALEELQPAGTFAEVAQNYILGAIAYWLWRAGGVLRWETEIPLAYQAMIRGDWRTAASEWARIGCPYERALALAEGDLDAQREALAIFEGLGARPAARLLRERMIEGGVKRLPRGARPSTQANPAGLTAREMDILALLEKGMSNSDIAAQLSISPKTVDHHVSAILGKLQVRSRLEAAALARQKGIR